MFLKLGLHEFSPLFLCALRFIFASIPAVFFIKPPKVPFKLVVLYGLLMFALQFSLMFIGISVGMPAGLASILIQVQVFFSIFFAVLFLGEQPSLWQISGALVSFTGIAVVGLHVDSTLSLTGFFLILASAASWGFGNLITKKIGNCNMVSLIIWGCFISSFPMLLLSLVLEGPASIAASYHHMTWVGIGSLLYIVYISTWLGYGIWNWLLSRHPLSMVVPYTLLVPIVGVMSSVVFLGEPFQPWKLAAGVLVIGGLGINILGPRLFIMKTPAEA